MSEPTQPTLSRILEAYYEYRQSQEGDGNVPPKGALSKSDATQAITKLMNDVINIEPPKGVDPTCARLLVDAQMEGLKEIL